VSLLHRLGSRIGRRRRRGRIAFNLAPRSSPYGGGNQFVRLLSDHLRDHGYEVVHRAGADLDAVVLVDGRPELTTFGIADVSALKRDRPSLVCVHRVNECDQRKGTAGMDELLARTNEVADHTVFISAWLRDHHAGKWFDRSRPHSVILNGADPRVFHPPCAMPPAGPFRIVTHHWSDHAMKGFNVYAEVDRLIAQGALPGAELWVIGRWPAEIQWRSARLFPPRTGTGLAELLRQCHAYLTASRWEPGGMHFIEGAQCGLPVVYHEDGGGIVELASRFGIGFRSDVGAAITRVQAEYGGLRDRVLTDGPSGDQMCFQYRRLLERMLARRASA
jgi:glycosyltransferase involved in cell wall biosynthesis